MRTITFTGQMNRDTHPKFLGEGDYLDAMNIYLHTGKDGKKGLLRKYPGFDVSVGAYIDSKTLGSVVDQKNNRVFYFRQDGIWIYNVLSNTHEHLIDHDFGFGEFVNGGIIGDSLYITDNKNQPMEINISRDYDTIAEKDITIIKPAPLFPMDVIPINELVNYSALSGNSYMFSYRYRYDSGQYSVIAPYTRSYYCPEEPPFISVMRIERNTRESIPNYVQSIDILVREGDGPWMVFETSTRERFEIGHFMFRGTKGRALSVSESSKPFENVPEKSKTLQVARDRVFLGNNTEGYDPYEVPSLALLKEPLDVTPEPEYLQIYMVTKDHSVDWTINPADPQVYRTIDINYYVRRGNLYYLLASGTKTEYYNGTITDEEPGDYTGSETELTANESDYLSQSQVSYNNTHSTFQYDRSSSQGLDHFVFLTLTGVFSVGKEKFKNRSQYQIGIVFYEDYLKNQGVYTNENCIQSINDDFRNNQVDQLKWKVDISDSIPDWATTYQIVRTDNLDRASFYQGKTSDIYWVTDEGYSRTYRSDATHIEVDIAGSFKDDRPYNFSEGDLMDIELTPDSWGYGTITVQILGASGSRVSIRSIDKENFESIAQPIEMYYEIWTPRTEVSTSIINGEEVSGNIFYEVSEVYPVVDPKTENRSFSVTEGVLRGDVIVEDVNTYGYGPARAVVEGKFENNTLDPTPEPIVIESIIRDKSGNWVKDLGRPNAVLGQGPSHKPSFVRWSNRLIQGTDINGTSRFDLNDEIQVPVENGDINSLLLISKQQSDGNVMLAICEQETSSMYLGEVQFMDTEGTEVIGTTSSVIGTIQTLKGNYGTKHPRSVVAHKGRAWWWDYHSKTVVRYDPNGLRPISDLENRSLFFGHEDDALCAYDPFHNMFFISHGNNTVAFHEEFGQWRGHYSFLPEHSCIINDYMVTFYDGLPYRSNGDGNSFYGETYEAEITFACQYPSPTILDRISVYMTKGMKWENARQKMDDVLDFEITNEEGQKTTLTNVDFDINESVANAFVLRDENSPGGLLEGYEMMSDIHIFKLKLRDTEIEYININETESR